jgi:hypothetical protein
MSTTKGTFFALIRSKIYLKIAVGETILNGLTS